MAITTDRGPATTPRQDGDAWRGYVPGPWQDRIDVRDFIQRNYEPYEGDGSFVAPPTPRTLAVWGRLQELFLEERKKGVLDVSQIPSSITAHGPGYIDRDREIIVGLQTDAPLKRAIMPNGGLRLVVNALQAYGYEPDPQVIEAGVEASTSYTPFSRSAGNIPSSCCQMPVVRSVGPARKAASPVYGV